MFFSALLAANLFGSPAAEAAPINFQKIADTSTRIPGVTGESFSGFWTRPAISGGSVVFAGQRNGSPYGVYTGSGGPLTVIADRTTWIPDGDGTFTGFQSLEPSISGSTVAFQGQGAQSPPGGPLQFGIYTGAGGDPAALANRDTMVPGETFEFSSYSDPSIDDGNVAFQGTSHGTASNSGIYIERGGTLQTVADLNTLVPDGGGARFSGFFRPQISGEDVVFWANYEDGNANLVSGIYAQIDGQLVKVADENTIAPESANQEFKSFSSQYPSIDSGIVAFRGSVGLTTGIYRYANGVLENFVDTDTQVPGQGNGVTFNTIRLDPSISDESIAFRGFFGGGPSLTAGIYTDLMGDLIDVIVVGDLLDGKTIADLSFGRDGLSGSSLTFWVEFTDQTEAIYRASVGPSNNAGAPELTTLTLMGLGLAGFGFSRLRKHSGAVGD